MMNKFGVSQRKYLGLFESCYGFLEGERLCPAVLGSTVDPLISTTPTTDSYSLGCYQERFQRSSWVGSIWRLSPSLELSLSKIEPGPVRVIEFYILHHLFQIITSHILLQYNTLTYHTRCYPYLTVSNLEP